MFFEEAGDNTGPVTVEDKFFHAEVVALKLRFERKRGVSVTDRHVFE